MKRLLLVLFLASIFNANGQTNNELLSHFQKYYEQMRAQGDPQGLINALTHLNVLQPSKPRADTLAFLYVNQNNHLQALNVVGIENNPNDSDLAVQVKAISLKKLGQAEKANEQFEILFSRGPSAYLAYELADLKIQLNDLAGATEKITYGLTNVKDEEKYAYYERQTPYEVPLKAGLTYLKSLVKYNEDKTNNIDAAITLMDEALALAPNFNLALISKQALEQRKKDANKE